MGQRDRRRRHEAATAPVPPPRGYERARQRDEEARAAPRPAGRGGARGAQAARTRGAPRRRHRRGDRGGAARGRQLRLLARRRRVRRQAPGRRRRARLLRPHGRGGGRDLARALLGGARLPGAARPDHPRLLPRAVDRVERRGARRLPRRDLRRGVPLLEARPGDGAHPDAATARVLESKTAMPDTSFDTIVIGSGPGGYVPAIRASQLGMKTAVVEKDTVGGRCLNYACIPAKAILRAADVLQEVRDADEFGVTVGDPAVDYAAVMARRAKVVKTLTGGVAGLFKKNGVEYVEGVGTLAGGRTVKVGDRELEAAKCVVLATGSVPRALPGTTFGGRVIGTEEAWALEELPGSLAVVGAGASGAEIASAFARLGSEVLLFEALDRVLPSEDADISKAAGRALAKQGMSIHTKTFVTDVQPGESSVTFKYGDESGEVDYLVIAAGRGPDVPALGLEAAGVKLTEH